MTKEQAKKEIEKLVNRFESHIEEYKNSDYNETQTRRDFIDPFFKTLGWDIDNEQDYAEAYREVIHEAKQKVKEGKIERTKAPDYAFRIGGKKIFFLEAKKPSVSLKDSVHPAYQVRRYGWSAKLPISIITDFEELSVYDCTKKPIPTDKAVVARLKYITYKDYLNEFDFIWNTFSKESVLKGSFDKFVKSDTNKKGTATVDFEFLQSLDKWRTYLATSISLNNKNLDEDELNFVIQQTIDRLIFMRIAEDRNVEFYGQLKNCITKGNYYQNLFEVFKKADEKYNSGLFDFKKDSLSKNVTIDNKVIKNIITELYYPNCPYEFSVLSVEILGSAYEQFLGKTITIDKAHIAKIEEKPEVRKAGGVYYTPQYVVEYIVKNTVGKLIEGKTPKEIEKIKIVDPACGSGSFLIGAFQFLLDYHKDFYSNKGKPVKGKKESTLTPEENLTSAEKKKILINNIFGVDLDINAVEVTKLSLLLKCMEGETEASINQQLKLWNERILPDLDNNIKSGNSLIDEDFYAEELFEQERKIKPFNWQKAFPEVFNVKTIEDEEELNMFHITCVMHNTRTSKRMIDNKVKVGKPEYLSLSEENKLIEIIEKIIKDENLEILEFNISADHIHFAIVCPSNKLTAIVGKIKSISAKEFNIWRGITMSLAKDQTTEQTIVSTDSTRGHTPDSTRRHASDSTRGHASDSTRGHAPLSSRGDAPLYTPRGETQNSLWAQKFNQVEIKDDNQLRNVLQYIKNNRIKHKLPTLSEESQNRIKSFVTSYNDAFSPKIQNGGFDIVLGNPPWVDIKGHPQELVKYYFDKFSTTENRINLYSIFIEQGLKILSKNGVFGFIIPNSILYQSSYEKIRRLILKDFAVNTIVRLPDNVFQNVKAETIILSISKSAKQTDCLLYDRNNIINEITDANCIEKKQLKSIDWLKNELCVFDIFSNKSELELLKKIENNKTELIALTDFTLGLTPYDKYKGHTQTQIQERVFHSKTKKDNTFKQLLEGADVKRYSVFWGGKEYISYGKWLGAPREARFFNVPRILVRQIVSGNPLRIYAGYTDKELYNTQSVFNIISKDENRLNTKYLLALLNSNLINFYHGHKFLDLSKNLFQKILIQNCKKFPIKTINNKEDIQKQNEIIKFVDHLLQLNEEIQKTNLESKRIQLLGKIEYFENQINEIVYQLYDLTEDEIKTIKQLKK
ncbi:MAG: hypothetical protein A2X08_01825 [Bacteroidetes bacterium GWA2_32_17]|nr:MAG: hypothetical protein A2X08_01825 [Bacteroidetes bacterium GWA2_32_17]